MCETAVFIKGISIGMCGKTIKDVAVGFGRSTGAYRVYPSHSEDQDSEFIALIGGHTKNGTIHQMKTVVLRFVRNRNTDALLPSYPQARNAMRKSYNAMMQTTLEKVMNS